MKMDEDIKVSDKELDEVYDAVDALMLAGCWNILNEIFLSLESKAWRISIDLLLAYATASLPAKNKIPSREPFINRCMQLYPDKKLWKGLK